MRKAMTVGFAALMAAGLVNAEDETIVVVDQGPVPGVSEPLVTAEAALVSSYVWRGQVLNNDAVIQPQLTLSQYDVSLNIWGNWDAAGSNVSGVSDDFSEIDISLAYTLPIDINDVAFDVGVIHYTFPNTTAESTTELFGSATLLTWSDYVIPSVTLFGDVDEVNGTYLLFDVMVPFEISEYFDVAGGISAGYGNTSYNSAYWTQSADGGFNDYNFYGTASYEIVDNVTASLNLTYTMLEGGTIRDAADANYEAKEKFWAGVNIAYDF